MGSHLARKSPAGTPLEVYGFKWTKVPVEHVLYLRQKLDYLGDYDSVREGYIHAIGDLRYFVDSSGNSYQTIPAVRSLLKTTPNSQMLTSPDGRLHLYPLSWFPADDHAKQLHLVKYVTKDGKPNPEYADDKMA